MQNIQLSPHFELHEFTESATARKHGIVNEPPPEAVENLRGLCIHTLEPLRDALGLPIIITSGYRCKALNERITHHSTRSQHMQGQAADFYVAQGLVSSFRSQVSGKSFKSLFSSFKSLVSGNHLNHETSESSMKHETKAPYLEHETSESSMKHETTSRRELLIKAFRQIILDDGIDFDQLIIYPTFIHVSYVSNGKNRHKLTRGFGNSTYDGLTRAQALKLE